MSLFPLPVIVSVSSLAQSSPKEATGEDARFTFWSPKRKAIRFRVRLQGAATGDALFHCFATKELAIRLCYPFTAPAVSPATILYWNIITRMTSGMVTTIEAAMIAPHGCS